jgi:outer membrane receptor protein involved in Fe transport
MRIKIVSSLIAFAGTICLTAIFVCAQVSVGGSITGLVTDSSGGVVPKVAVRAVNTATLVVTEATANQDGLYVINVIPGNYAVTVEATGFKKNVSPDVAVGVGVTVRVNATLQVGSATQEITVTGEAPMLQTESGEVSQAIGSNEIADLPTVGRNYTRLELLSPGTTDGGAQLQNHPENSGGDYRVSVNGQSQGNNYHSLDGVDNNETVQGLSMIVPPDDSIHEVKISTSNYDTEFDVVAGAVIQVSTKSGTDQYHGSLFEYYRGSGLFASDPFTKKDPLFVWNQFGGSFGGHLIKSKLFVFGDYQGMRNHLGGSSITTLPTQAMRNGDFSAFSSTFPIFDPLTGNPDGTGRTQFSCNGVLNVICPSRISPAATNLLALLPLPTNPTAVNNNYIFAGSSVFNQNQFDSRIDYVATSNTRIMGRYSLFHAFFNTPAVFGVKGGGGPISGSANTGTSDPLSQAIAADYYHTFSSTLLSEVRFGYGRFAFVYSEPDAHLNTASEVGIPGINQGDPQTAGLPSITASGPVGGFFMGDTIGPFPVQEVNVDVMNNWTKILGKHAIKWGADIKRSSLLRQDQNGRGTMNFLTDTTADLATPNSGIGVATFLLGLTTNYSRNIASPTYSNHEQQWRNGIYAQDNWNPIPKLTLTYGLRWEFLSPIFGSEKGGETNLDTNTGNVLLSGYYDKYAGVTPDYTKFEPRFGAAYRLRNSMVLRGGYGRSYALNIYGANFGTQAINWPNSQTQSIGPVTTTGYVFSLDKGPPPTPALPPLAAQIPLPNGISEYFPGVGKYQNQWVDTWNVTFQQQVSRDAAFQIAYMGSHGEHLWTMIDINKAVPGPGPQNLNQPFFAKFGWEQSLIHNSGNAISNYNGLQANFHAKTKSLLLNTNFSWSKALDEVGANGYTVQNYFDLRSNYAPSDVNRKLLQSTALTYSLPFGPGQRWATNGKGAAAYIIGGWNINGIVVTGSGLPFTVIDTSLANYNSNPSLGAGLGNGFTRTDQSGSASVPHPSRQQWFNGSVFQTPGLYSYGDVGRNSLIGPDLAQADLELFKEFRISEGKNLRLEWQAINAFNRTNLSNPANNIASPLTIGQITSTFVPMRQMLIGAHFTF